MPHHTPDVELAMALQLGHEYERAAIGRVAALLGLPGTYAEGRDLTESIIRDPDAARMARELVKAAAIT